FAGDRAGDAAIRPRAHRLDRRWRDHGRAAPDRIRRGRPVPPRIDPDARGQAPAGQLPRPAPGSREVTLTPQEAIARLAAGRPLGEAGAAAVVEAVLAEAATPAQVGAILLGLRQKGETVEELVGAAPLAAPAPPPLP